MLATHAPAFAQLLDLCSIVRSTQGQLTWGNRCSKQTRAALCAKSVGGFVGMQLDKLQQHHSCTVAAAFDRRAIEWPAEDLVSRLPIGRSLNAWEQLGTMCRCVAGVMAQLHGRHDLAAVELIDMQAIHPVLIRL